MNQSREMRNKGPKKPKVAPQARKPEAPVFVYISVCCNVGAVKPALKKTPEAEGTLGSWLAEAAESRANARVPNTKFPIQQEEYESKRSK